MKCDETDRPSYVVGIATRYRRNSPGIETRWGATSSAPTQKGPGAHPAAPLAKGIGPFPGSKAARQWQ